MTLTFGNATFKSQRISAKRENAIFMRKFDNNVDLFTLINCYDYGNGYAERIFNLIVGHLGQEAFSAQTTLQDLIETIHQINATICEVTEAQELSLSLLLVLDEQLHVLHVGTNRIYSVTPQSIKQISHTHDFVTALLEHEAATCEEINNSSFRNIQYRSFGNQFFDFDLSRDTKSEQAETIHFPKQSCLLLHTRGFHWAKTPLFTKGWCDEPTDTMHQLIVQSKNPQDVCDRLIAEMPADAYHDASVICIARDFAFKS